MVVFCQKKIQFPRSTWKTLNTPGSDSVGSKSPWGGFWLLVLAQPAGFWTLPSWVEWPLGQGRRGSPSLGSSGAEAVPSFVREGMQHISSDQEWLRMECLTTFTFIWIGIFQRQAEISQWVFFRVEFFWRAEGGTLAAEPILQMKCPCVTISKLTQHIKLPHGHSQGFSGWCFSEQEWKRREVCSQTGSSDGWYSGQLWAPGVEPHRTNLW